MSNIPDRNSDRHHQVIDAMERFGGGFVVALAFAWRKADHANHVKLYHAFQEYYQEYDRRLAASHPASSLRPARRGFAHV